VKVYPEFTFMADTDTGIDTFTSHPSTDPDPHLPSQLNQYLYLPPEQLTANEANEKARPMESAERRAARVREMAESIACNGQEYPVLVVEVSEGESVTYEYVDGGCRVEAIALLNEQYGLTLDQPKELKLVWCSLLNPTDDLFKIAVVANLHRTQNSIMEMAYIVHEARERNGWTGRGSTQKVADYLGILPSRVSEFEKMLHAPQAVKSRIESGEIQSMDAALKLLQAPPKQQEEIMTRAEQIAREEEKEEPDGRVDAVGDAGDDIPDAVPSRPKRPKKVKIQAKHVQQAKREKQMEVPRTRAQMLDWVVGCTVSPYPAPVRVWAKEFERWAKGKSSDEAMTKLFDEAVHSPIKWKPRKGNLPKKGPKAKGKK
jgi:hypothetical protein